MNDYKHYVTSFPIDDFLKSLKFVSATNEKLDENKLIEFFGFQEISSSLKDSAFVQFYAVKKGYKDFKKISDNPETTINRTDCLKTIQLVIKIIDDFSDFYDKMNSLEEAPSTEKIRKYIEWRKNEAEKKYGAGWNPLISNTNKEIISDDCLSISLLGELRDKLHEIHESFFPLKELEFITTVSYSN